VAAGEPITSEEAKAIVDHPDYNGQHCLHDKIMEQLLEPAGPIKPPPEEEPFYHAFGDDVDQVTYQLMCQMNYLTVEHLLQKRVAACKKNPKQSPCHVSRGPFTLQRSEKDPNTILIRNNKKKMCLNFPYRDHRLDSTPYRLNLKDWSTYHFLCQYGPSRVASYLQGEYRNGNAHLQPSSQLLVIKKQADSDKIATVIGDSGILHEFLVSDLQDLHGDWTPGGTGSLFTWKKVKKGNSNTAPTQEEEPKVSHSNPYSPLSDDEEPEQEGEASEDGASANTGGKSATGNAGVAANIDCAKATQSRRTVKKKKKRRRRSKAAKSESPTDSSGSSSTSNSGDSSLDSEDLAEENSDSSGHDGDDSQSVRELIKI